MRISLVFLTLVWIAWPREAWATWHVTACGEAMESNLCFATYADCAADLSNWYSLAPAGCEVMCEPYYGSCSLDAAVASTSSSTTSWSDIPGRYRIGKRGYPYGRTQTVGGVAAVGVGLGLDGGGGARLAGRPTTMTQRVTPRFSIGGFFGLHPSMVATLAGVHGTPAEGSDDELGVGIAGGHLRYSAWARASRNARSYRELYLEVGGGIAWMSETGWDGRGNVSTATLGIYVMSHYAFGIGLSTGLTYASVADASEPDTGRVVDVKALVWNALMVEIIAGI